MVEKKVRNKKIEERRRNGVEKKQGLMIIKEMNEHNLKRKKIIILNSNAIMVRHALHLRVSSVKTQVRIASPTQTYLTVPLYLFAPPADNLVYTNKASNFPWINIITIIIISRDSPHYYPYYFDSSQKTQRKNNFRQVIQWIKEKISLNEYLHQY